MASTEYIALAAIGLLIVVVFGMFGMVLHLGSRINTVNARIDALRNRLDARLDALSARLSAHIDRRAS